MRLSLKVPASENGVRGSLGKIRSHLKRFGAVADEIDTAELVLGEAMNNVVEHALVADASAEFAVDVSCSQGTLACRIIDAGRAMPGLRIPKGQRLAPGTTVDELPEGGFGWMLIRDLTSALSYSRLDGENLLEFDLPMEIKT